MQSVIKNGRTDGYHEWNFLIVIITPEYSWVSDVPDSSMKLFFPIAYFDNSNTIPSYTILLVL